MLIPAVCLTLAAACGTPSVSGAFAPEAPTAPTVDELDAPAGVAVRDARARARAAAHLQRGLAATHRDDASSSERMIALLDVAERAVRELGARRSARVVRDAAASAEWRAFVGDDEAWRALANDLARLRDDLRFEPVREAEMPVGFPEPTPVLELRRKSYPAYRLARTSMRGPFGTAAFWRLFQHIESHEIAMTAPVEMTYDDAGETRGGSTMAFLYGDPAIGEPVTLEPGDASGVEVVDIPAIETVAIGCRGRMTDRATAELRRELERWIALRPDYEAAGPLRVMGYNSPRVPAARSYFEVEIPVRRVTADGAR